MKDLFGFNTAEEGEIALCELDGRLNCMQYDYANINAFTNAVREVMKYNIKTTNTILSILGG